MPGLVRLTPAARTVVRACTAAGGRPLVVGGSVRDAILGDHEPKDVDIEVYDVADKESFLDAMADVGDWSDTVGRAFGVVKIRLGDESFDVSLPRRYNKTGRRAQGLRRRDRSSHGGRGRRPARLHGQFARLGPGDRGAGGLLGWASGHRSRRLPGHIGRFQRGPPPGAPGHAVPRPPSR